MPRIAVESCRDGILRYKKPLKGRVAIILFFIIFNKASHVRGEITASPVCTATSVRDIGRQGALL